MIGEDEILPATEPGAEGLAANKPADGAGQTQPLAKPAGRSQVAFGPHQFFIDRPVREVDQNSRRPGLIHARDLINQVEGRRVSPRPFNLGVGR
jgi:hypothetical protein